MMTMANPERIIFLDIPKMFDVERKRTKKKILTSRLKIFNGSDIFIKNTFERIFIIFIIFL